MRLPEKLMGYVEYEGVNYPFNFDKVSFMIVDPKPVPNLTHGNLETPYHVAVFPQQCPCIVIVRVFGHVCRWQPILRHCRSLLSAGS